MKKLFSLFVVMFCLSNPFTANAISLGTGYIDLAFSPPTGGGYYLDYDGQVLRSDFGYTTPIVEVFCVSPQSLNDATFRFYSITNEVVTGLDAVFGVDTFNRLARAAWVADHWTDWGTDDFTKGEAQKAVWMIMNVMNILGTDGLDVTIYDMAMAQTPTVNNNWYFAYTPANPGDPNYQDYLTPAPVPEPSTILLLGAGLLGSGLVARRRKK